MCVYIHIRMCIYIYTYICLYIFFVIKKPKHIDKVTTLASFLSSVDVWHEFNKLFYWPTFSENKPLFKKKKILLPKPLDKRRKEKVISMILLPDSDLSIGSSSISILGNKSDINPESVKSKYGFAIQGGG